MQVLGVQKNRFIETVLLSTHNIRGVKFHSPAPIGKLSFGSGELIPAKLAIMVDGSSAFSDM